MSTSYRGHNSSQRQRRKMLNRVRSRLGDKLFADFIVDLVSQHGAGGFSTIDIPSLADLWIGQRLKRFAKALRGS